MAVQEPVHDALHFVAQSSVVGIETHCVLQWSSQHAPHDAWQSVEEDADEDELVPPSAAASVEEELDELDAQDALHPASQREVQSVVQSRAGGLAVQVDEQLDWQLKTQLASADALHLASHVCSSFAAQAFSHDAGVHCVVQLFSRTRLHCALTWMSMLPHAETVAACAARGITAKPTIAREANAMGWRARRAIFGKVFTSTGPCNR